jgi:hypothetical protein
VEQVGPTQSGNCESSYQPACRVFAFVSSGPVSKVRAAEQSDLQIAEPVRSPRRAPTCIRSLKVRRPQTLVGSERLQCVHEHFEFSPSSGRDSVRRSSPSSGNRAGPLPETERIAPNNFGGRRAHPPWNQEVHRGDAIVVRICILMNNIQKGKRTTILLASRVLALRAQTLGSANAFECRLL